METDEVIRVVLAEDHSTMREAIRVLLELSQDIQVIGEAKDGVEALELVQSLSPDVLLCDVEMPGLGGVQLVDRLQAEGSPIPVLAISAYDDKEYISGMIRNGAMGYLLKEDIPEFLIPAVRGVAQGELGWVSPLAADKILPSWK